MGGIVIEGNVADEASAIAIAKEEFSMATLQINRLYQRHQQQPMKDKLVRMVMLHQRVVSLV